MFNVGMPELIVIFIVVLFLFGAKALPDIARSIAKSIGIFKREVRNISEEMDIHETEQSLKEPENKKSEDSSTDSVIAQKNDFDTSTERRDWRPKSANDSPSEKS